MPWRPIDTAPRDTVPILVWNGSDYAIVEPLGSRGWIIHNSFGFNEDGEVPNVTHWMSLPEPPQ